MRGKYTKRVEKERFICWYLLRERSNFLFALSRLLKRFLYREAIYLETRNVARPLAYRTEISFDSRETASTRAIKSVNIHTFDLTETRAKSPMAFKSGFPDRMVSTVIVYVEIFALEDINRIGKLDR